ACSLIADAADPDANIIFGSVIDAHAGDSVRITVIATGFNGHASEQPAPSMGRSQSRGREGQMALPMQAASAHPSSHAVSHAASTPTPRGGFSAPGIRINDGSEAINLDDFYSNMEQVPAVPMGATPANAVPAAAPEW